MRRNPLQAVWETLHEPRTITAIMICAYAVAAGIGLAVFNSTPVAGALTTFNRVTTAFLLIFAGIAGIPSAWTGRQWLEQAAAFAFTGGTFTTGLHVLAVHDQYGLKMPWIHFLSLVLVAMFGLTRFIRIRKAPYRPGTGPLIPEQRAAIHDILTQDRFEQAEAKANRD